MSTTETITNGATGTVEETPAIEESVSVETLVATAIKDLPRKSFDDKSQIYSLDTSSAIYATFEESVAEWADSNRKRSAATRKACLSTLALRYQVRDAAGNPILHGSPFAWKILYLDRIKSVYEASAMTAEEVKAFEAAIRRYDGDRGLKRAVAFRYAVETTNGLAGQTMKVDRGPRKGETLTLGEVAKLATSGDSSVSIPLDGMKIPAAVQKVMTPLWESQKTGNGKRAAGFEVNPAVLGPKDPDTSQGGNDGDEDPDSVGNVGHATVNKAAEQVLHYASEEETFNPDHMATMIGAMATAASDRIVGTADSKGLAMSKIKRRAELAAKYKAVGELLHAMGALLAGDPGITREIVLAKRIVPPAE